MSEVFQIFECGDVFQFTDPADSYATWQGLRGPKGDPGEPGPPGEGLVISGIVDTVGELPATADQGEIYLVGEEAPYTAYLWNEGTWTSIGQITVGPQGPPGEDGQDGAAAGFGTPTISVGSGTGTPSASVTASGPDTAKVFAFAFENLKGAQGNPGTPGQDGADGQDGVSPEVTIGTITGGHSVTITDADHPTGQTFNVMDGEDGAPGTPGTPGTAAGFGTPTATIGSGTGPPSVQISASGPDTAKVFAFAFDNLKGAKGDTGDTGPTGPTGPAGPGVPAGGSSGQVLTKTSGTDYATQWATPEAGGGALYFPSVAMTATTGTIISISDAAITADYVLANVVFSKPAAVTAGGTFSSGAGTFTMTGTCTDATCTAQITLVKKSN